ncbi:sarcosine oxidase subunit gamma [Nocardia transvalensis]|uniref:Sarcosine oxidase subunit gamma n=1 Tax=Nocardia transvalensis TaxID=37333 RepID=A0A7W9PAM6_9NOCA|nr:sarcosine oxidase subunit gamma family protein [Nocardia transvalensis]MBB5912194.1 sarcosine oxidase subunit gamma [Nocardia transvalensis]
MADTLTPISPLGSWSHRFAVLPATVTVAEEPFTAMVNLWVDRAGPGTDAARRVLGFDLPTAPGTSAGDDRTTAIWLSPEEWLVTSRSTSPSTLETDLRAAVDAHGGAATDVSGQRTTVRLTGSRARDVLTKGCSIDLHPRVFHAGSAVQTMLGRAGVVLIAVNDDGNDYRILVRASFARYLAEWLVDAAEEFGPGR